MSEHFQGRDSTRGNDIAGPDVSGGVGFNAPVTENRNPFQGVGTGADVRKEPGTLEDFAQPRVGAVYVDNDASGPRTTAGDTMTGATSADVHQGAGHPGQGMTSKELHHDGHQTRTRQRVGDPAARSGSGFVPQNDSEMASDADLQEIPGNQIRGGQ